MHLVPASHQKLCTYAEPQPISWAKPVCFDFSSSNFKVWGNDQYKLVQLGTGDVGNCETGLNRMPTHEVINT
jgi:hypothetical protein